MGLFSDLFGGSSNSSSSTTSTSDNRVAATEQATVSQGEHNQTGGTQLRTGSGRIDLAINNSDLDVIKAALGTVEDVITNQSDLTLRQATAGASALSQANQSLADLAQTKSTGGDSNAQRTIIIAVLIFGALGAAFFFFTRKH